MHRLGGVSNGYKEWCQVKTSVENTVQYIGVLNFELVSPIDIQLRVTSEPPNNKIIVTKSGISL